MAYNIVPVLAWNKFGDRYVFYSIKNAAKGLGVSEPTIRKRMKDGHPILIKGLKGIYVRRG